MSTKFSTVEFICGVEDRPAELNLDCSAEFIGRELLIKVDQNVAVYPFRDS
ncbi:MAG: hypothetical protein MZV63_02465 [Marinilabiliales bacterium]|nr:hypothetical protein [Marinilabiliales bacterium]